MGSLDQANVSPLELEYGLASEAVEEAITWAAGHGNLHRDPTCSGKSFAAFLAAARSRSRPGPLLFWNTKNAYPLPRDAMLLDYEALPDAFHRFFSGKPGPSMFSFPEDHDRG